MTGFSRRTGKWNWKEEFSKNSLPGDSRRYKILASENFSKGRIPDWAFVFCHLHLLRGDWGKPCRVQGTQWVLFAEWAAAPLTGPKGTGTLVGGPWSPHRWWGCWMVRTDLVGLAGRGIRVWSSAEVMSQVYDVESRRIRWKQELLERETGQSGVWMWGNWKSVPKCWEAGRASRNRGVDRILCHWGGRGRA